MPYGDLFFAAAATLEDLLPEVGSAQRMVVILSLHGFEEVGSTFIGVLRRFTETLHAADGRLYVVGVSPASSAVRRARSSGEESTSTRSKGASSGARARASRSPSGVSSRSVSPV